MFILRVNITGIADVIDDSHSTLRNRFKSTAHLILHHHPITLDTWLRSWLTEVSQLHPVEGKLVPPALTPVCHHATQKLLVALRGSTIGVRLSLIPNRAAVPVAHDRRNHTIVDGGGHRRIFPRVTSLARTTRLSPLLVLLPLGQLFLVGLHLFLKTLFHLFWVIPGDRLGLHFQKGFSSRQLTQSLFTRECLNRLPTPGTLDHSNRHAQLRTKLLRKVVTNRGKRPGVLWPGRLPISLPVFLRATLRDIRRNKNPQ